MTTRSWARSAARSACIVGAALTVLVSAPQAFGATGPVSGMPADVPASSLDCHGSLADSPNTPVLFIHGTGSNTKSDWSWNWNRAFDQRGWSYCTVELPERATADIQISAEYVVSALRSMHAEAGRKTSIVGHSQGGMIGRWAFEFWPDTRALVDDYVGLASSNHGSTKIADVNCGTDVCNAASWQQRAGSNFLGALNDGGETYPEIDYTEVATVHDEIVTPYTSTYLTQGPNVTNVAVQDICPLDPTEHFAMSADNAAWVLGLDALQNPGPADPNRVDRSLCAQVLMPGIDLAALPENVSAALTVSFGSESTQLSAEPDVAGYARR